MAIIAIDLGGTNIRFGLAESEAEPLCEIAVMACADFPSINDAINSYIDSLPKGLARDINAVCIAVAGPVFDDWIDITNNNWQFSKSALMQSLGVERLMVINDFIAQALAQTSPDCPGNVLIKKGIGNTDAPLLVIGPGTGLGVAALKQTPYGAMPIEGEGGHIYYTPRNDHERHLEDFLRKEIGFVSAEHIISGGGLENIYRFLCHHDQVAYDHKTAVDIGDAAVNSNGRERQAVFMMLESLATVMVNNIITMGCWQGAVIAGGIVPRFEHLLSESQFFERFLDAGVLSETFTNLPIWLGTAQYLGLEGAREALKNPYLKHQLMTKS